MFGQIKLLSLTNAGIKDSQETTVLMKTVLLSGTTESGMMLLVEVLEHLFAKEKREDN